MSGPQAERVTEEHHGYAGGRREFGGHGGHVGAPMTNMVCMTWWLFVLILLATAAAGFVVYFVWQWWLLSRPDAKGS
jgi:hypothetical protein